MTVAGARLTDVSGVHLEFVTWSALQNDWTVMTDPSTGATYKLIGEHVIIQSDNQLTFTSPCGTRDDTWKDCAAGADGSAPTCGFRVVLTSNSTGVDSVNLLQQPLISYQTAYAYSPFGKMWQRVQFPGNNNFKNSVDNPNAAPRYICYHHPTIASISPKLVQPGSTVVIEGMNFGARRPDCGSPAPYFSVTVGPTACVPGACQNEILAWSNTRIEFRVSNDVPSGVHSVGLAVGGNSAVPLWSTGAEGVRGEVNVQNENVVPRALAFHSGDATTADVTWLPPLSTGVERYILMWTAFPLDAKFMNGTTKYAVSSATSFTLQPLVLGTTYRVRIIAQHSGENGTASDIYIQHSVPADAPTWPNKPITFVSYTNGDVRAVASFDAPQSWGGGTPDSYTLEWTDLFTNPPTVYVKTVAVAESALQSELLTGLLPHRHYNLTVKATTKSLRGPAAEWEPLSRTSTLWDAAKSMISPTSAATVWHVTFPALPTGMKLTYLDEPSIFNLTHEVAISWSAPQSNGNAPINDYQISYSAQATAWTTGLNASFPLRTFAINQMAQTVVTQITIPSIRFGLPLCFAVAAQNAIGIGSTTATGTTTTCTCGAAYYLDGTNKDSPECKPCGANCDFCETFGTHKCKQCSRETTLQPSTGKCVKHDKCGGGQLPNPKEATDPTQGFTCVAAGMANGNCVVGQLIASVTSCGSCPAGTFSDLTGVNAKMECKPCELGTYAAITAQSVCKLCEKGTFTNMVASSSCTHCSLGKFNSKSGLSSAICDDCSKGRYARSTGATVCAACHVGFFAARNGMERCVGCEIGTFSASTGLSGCSKCDDGKYSINKASICWTCAGDDAPGYICIAGTLKVEEGFWFDSAKVHTMNHIDGTSTEYLCPGEEDRTLDGGENSCPHKCDANGGGCTYVEHSVLYECPEESSGDTVCDATIATADELAVMITVEGTNGTNASLLRLTGSHEGANASVVIPSMNCTGNAEGVLCALCAEGYKRARFGCEACEASAVILGFNSGQWLLNGALFIFGCFICGLSFTCMRNIRMKAKMYDTVHTIIVLKWFLRRKVIPRARALVKRKRQRELGYIIEEPIKDPEIADRTHIKVCVVSARHLKATDADGKSDPFVKVFWRPADTHSWMDMGKATKAKSNTVNPVWNRTWTLRTGKGLEPEVKLEIWDDDGVGSFADDAIGHVIYPLKASGPSSGWANIEGASGQLQAHVGYFPFTVPPQLPCFETKQATCYVTSASGMPDHGVYVQLLSRPDVSYPWTDTAFRTDSVAPILGAVDWNESFTFTAVMGARTEVRLLLCATGGGGILGRVDLPIGNELCSGFHVLTMDAQAIAPHGATPPLLRAAVGLGAFTAPTLEEDNAMRQEALAAAHGGHRGHLLGDEKKRRSTRARFQRAAHNAALMVATTGVVLEREIEQAVDDAVTGSGNSEIGSAIMNVISVNMEGRMAEGGGEADMGDIEGDGVLGIGTSDAGDAMQGDLTILNEIGGEATAAVGEIPDAGEVSGAINTAVSSIKPLVAMAMQQGKQIYEAAKAVYEPVMSQWKVLLGNLQILSSMQVVFASVPWPENYLKMLKSLEIFKFDVFGSFKVVVPCIDISFYDGVKAFLAVPVISFLAMVVAFLLLGLWNVFVSLCCKPCLSRGGCRKKREDCNTVGCCVDTDVLMRVKQRTAAGGGAKVELNREDKEAWRKANCKMRLGGKLCPYCCKKDLDWTSVPELSCKRGEVNLCPFKMEYLFVIEKLSITLILLLYPGLCNKCFLIFQCVEISGVEYLSSDYEQICWQGEHLNYFIAACCGVAVYIIGVPLFILARLVMFRCFSGAHDANGQRISLLHRPPTSTFLLDPYSDEINPHEIETAKNELDKQHYIQMRYGPLYEAYEDDYWFFELITIVRKLLLTGVIVLLANGDSKLLQLLAAIIVCLFYLVLVTSYQPFTDARDDRLAVAEALQMLLTMIIALALALDDGKDEQTTEYLGYLLIALTVFVLGLAVYQLPLIDLISHFCCCCCPKEEEEDGDGEEAKKDHTKKGRCQCRKSSKINPRVGGDVSMRNIALSNALVDADYTDGDAALQQNTTILNKMANTAGQTQQQDEQLVVMEGAVQAVEYDPTPTVLAETVMADMLAEAEEFLQEFEPTPPPSPLPSIASKNTSRGDLAEGLRRQKLRSLHANLSTQDSVRLHLEEFETGQEEAKAQLEKERSAKEANVRSRKAKRRVKQMAALRKRFLELDADGSGSISTHELMDLLPTDIPDDEAAALVEKFDADGSGGT